MHYRGDKRVLTITFTIRYSVVDSVGGDQDRAVDALLAMSDPEHVSTVHSPAREQPSVVRRLCPFFHLPNKHSHRPPIASHHLSMYLPSRNSTMPSHRVLRTPLLGRTNPAGRGVCAAVAAGG